MLRRFARLAYPLVGFPLLVLVGLELMVRFLMPQVLPRDAPEIYVPDPAIGWRRAPDVRTWVNTGERDVDFCSDARGNRISCNDPPRERCERRVLVIGDSFVEALALPFEQTAWSRIERDTGACVEVAGVGAYGVGQYLQLARERLRAPGARYDVVIHSFYAGNDFGGSADHVPDAQDVWRRPVRLLPPTLDRAGLREWFYPANQFLERVSHAYVALRFAARRFSDPGDAGIYGVPGALRRSGMTPEVLAEAVRAVSLVADEARAAGAHDVLTIVPVRNQVTDPEARALRAAMPTIADDLEMDLVQELFVPRVREIPGLTVVDLLPALRMDPVPENWESRDGHLSARGHEVWFSALRGPVRRALRLEASP